MEHVKATIETPRIVRKPEFINLNDMERMVNNDGRLVAAVCKYSTKVKRNLPLGRCDKDEFHLIKDWFALIPNKEAKAFAEWLLDLASASHKETFEEEYS